MKGDPQFADFDSQSPELRIMALRIRLNHNLLAIQQLLSVTQFGALITMNVRTSEGFQRLSEFCRLSGLSLMHINVDEHKSLAEVTSTLADNASRGVEAATLVFTHSIADDLLMDLCRILAEVDHELWTQKVENRTVMLKDMRRRAADDITKNLVEAYLLELGKESIVKKTDVLLSVLRPGDISSVISGFQFDRESLDRIDKLRHECAHREIKSAIPDLQDYISFLANMVRLFIKLAGEKYNLGTIDLL